MAIDWTRSPAVEVEVLPGETIYLRCAPNTAQSPLLGVTVGRGKYVSLWRAGSADPDTTEDRMPFPWIRLALLGLLLAGAGLSPSPMASVR
jgi:hypothetical protein